VAYCHLGAWDESERDLRRAAELQPGLAFVAENLRTVAWRRGQADFQAGRPDAGPGGRGASVLVSSFERYAVPIGDGRTVDVISLKNTPQTADQAGTEAVLRQITAQLRREGHLPADWQPSVLLAQPGLGSSASAERVNFAKMAVSAGKDFVLSVDMSDRFQWPNASRDLRAARIDEDVSRRLERAVVAANHVWGEPPDAWFGSQATRLLLHGAFGSVTVADLHDRGSLDHDFRLHRVVLTGVPLPGQSLSEDFRKTRLTSAMAITTPSVLGLIGSEPVKGAASVQVWELGGSSPSHGTLFAEQWRSRQPNPLPALVGLYLRGAEPAAVQQAAAARRDAVPIFTSPDNAPGSVPLAMASMTRHMLTDPTREAVLIGSKDPKLGQLMKAQFGDGWRVQVVAETDPARLQQLARQGGFTHIDAITGGPGSGPRAAERPGREVAAAASWTLVDGRAFAKGLDLYGKAMKLAWSAVKARDPAAQMPGGLAADLPLSLAGPLFEDLHSMRQGHFSPWVSRTLERLGEWGVGLRPDIVPPGATDLVKGLAQQVGRGSYKPSVEESIHYYDAFGKAAIYVAVSAYSGKPEIGRLGANAAGLAVELLDEYAIKPLAARPYVDSQVEAYRFNARQLANRGLEVPTMTRYFGEPALADLHLGAAVVRQNDAWATALNAQRAAPAESGARPRPEPPTPTIVTRAERQTWDKAAAGLAPTSAPGGYHLPSSAVPGDPRGGVAMGADVVKGQPADTGELLGGDPAPPPAAAPPPVGLICPLMLFGVAPEK
jgi:hypothetical protein